MQLRLAARMFGYWITMWMLVLVFPLISAAVLLALVVGMMIAALA